MVRLPGPKRVSPPLNALVMVGISKEDAELIKAEEAYRSALKEVYRAERVQKETWKAYTDINQEIFDSWMLPENYEDYKTRVPSHKLHPKAEEAREINEAAENYSSVAHGNRRKTEEAYLNAVRKSFHEQRMIDESLPKVWSGE